MKDLMHIYLFVSLVYLSGWHIHMYMICRKLSVTRFIVLEASFASQYLYHCTTGTVSDNQGTSGWVKRGKGMKAKP